MNFKNTVSCQNCSMNQLCLPFSLNDKEIQKLDEIIQRKRPLHKGDQLFQAGKHFNSLYAVRSGSFKSYSLSPAGEEQIVGFHLPGDIIGFDAINNQSHPTYSTALETAMVCEIPFNVVDQLSTDLPKLKTQIMRLMSNDIIVDREMMFLLNKKTAEQKLAAFIYSLSQRFKERGFSESEFRLTMTRAEIGNYLGLTVETISRLLSRFQKQELIKVEAKFIKIVDLPQLTELAKS
ncbi:fumarate/nitrate reduction transcriptional regulator Fnr [Catenovulum sp. 2E275]|uniref:fumarate/nitrate reduction transcriptional regulator Fnr n=1 Tax=Catenovulum sp. 2E275 TaxID=2980497 RepID=UPI0021CF78A9|nr:fumarate/nitrate reduction transcriptional regulator Fnr [Catenovulum sp. 2E275]MCU4674526.1 fumarate/nitrate reduction transcriptional regulator Fnr [Catenovulum sp. 2E275]